MYHDVTSQAQNGKVRWTYTKQHLKTGFLQLWKTWKSQGIS